LFAIDESRSAGQGVKLLLEERRAICVDLMKNQTRKLSSRISLAGKRRGVLVISFAEGKLVYLGKWPNPSLLHKGSYTFPCQGKECGTAC